MAAEFTPRDEEARRVILEDLDETLFVEASAGTGKTTSLVGRVVNLAASGRTTLARIAAITFTEAAAAELRDRIRQELEKAAEDSSLAEAERQRCRQGVADLDQAAIQTLHSFASALLHERPLEAGLPPGFETTDEIAATLKFDDAWDTWLDAALDEKSPVASHLAMALSLGMTLAQMKDVAKIFHKNYNDLHDGDSEYAEQTAGGVVETLRGGLEQLAGLCLKPDEGDRLFDYISRKLSEAEQVALAPSNTGQDAMTTGYLVGQILPLRPGGVGSAKNWPKEADPKHVRDCLREIEASVRREALLPVLRALRGFVLDYANQRRAEGRAEFHDLLVWAYQLLRDNIEARDHFIGRFTHLLIDESQDTDPLQSEIAIFLAEDVPAGANPGERPRDWQDTSPKKGKLFVVGDPKQSIYRFRRADVAQMSRLRGRMGGRTVGLTQNFRSQRPVTEWVNHVFRQWMGEGEEGAQADYEAMFHRWEGDTGHPFRPRVWALADEETEGSIDDIRRQEAWDIARLVRNVVTAPWQALDREATDAEGQERYRAATYADICILLPARTALRHLELALENAEVPYRLENASLVFETQEIRDLMNCFKAIDDPANQVATVAALRSPAFGCSDAELLRHRAKGGSFNYLARREDGDNGPVAAAMKELRDFHRARVWDSVGVLIDRFIRQRLLMEAALDHPRTREQWRRYRFVVEQARRFSEAAEPAGNSLRAFLEWMDNQTEENARVTETPVPEEDEDAVRVMTVHAAKGLEFPVVILTGLNSPRRNSSAPALFDRSGSRVEVCVGPRDKRFSTAGYEAVSEREEGMDEAERVRLMYVACTRARDHLALSLRRTVRDGKRTAAGKISEYLKDIPALWEAVSVEPPPAIPAADGATNMASLDHSPEARDQWLRQRKTLLENMGRPAFVAATALSHEDDGEKRGRDSGEKGERDAAEPWRRGRAGTLIGRALHVVLQSADLDTGSDIEAWAKAQAIAEGVPEREQEIAQRALRAIESKTVRRAIASDGYWREAPVAIPMGGGSLQGFIDLLFEEDGELVVVDYKTDEVGEDPDTAIDRYRIQGAAYALAVQKATGKAVKEVIFLFPNAEGAIEAPLTNLPALTAEAEGLALERLGGKKG